MKGREKSADDIIEETMKDIYDTLNYSDDSDAEEQDDDIEFIEIDLDEEFTDSGNKFFARRGSSDEDDDVSSRETHGGSEDGGLEDDAMDENDSGAESDPEEDWDDESDPGEADSEEAGLEDEEDSEEADLEDEEDSEEADSEDEENSEEADSEDEEDSEEADSEDEEDSEEDDAEDEEDAEEADSDESASGERLLKKHKRRRMAAIVCGSIAGVLVAVYIGFAVYFGSHFLFNTAINGTDFGMKDVSQVEAYMEKQVEDYSLSIEKSDGSTEKIDGTDISIKYVPGEELKELVKKQNRFFWIESLWKKPVIEASIGVKYDKKKLEEEIGKLDCMVAENQVPSVDAHPEFKDTEFVVIPEVIGTQIDTEKFHKVLEEAIDGFLPSVDLTEKECYLKPRFLKDSEQVIAAKDAMNSYLGANVTYDFHPYTEVVDASVISQWVAVDGEMNVTFNQDAVKGYIAALAEKYDTIGKTREFTTANGNVVSVNPGTYGWEMDQETEYAALTANIQNGETVTREPAYFSTAATHDAMDMGNTYAEVDLSAQHMWLFQGGQVVLDSDVVTGNPNIWNRETPSGVYSILEMQQNKTLVGEKDPKTGKPEYETPVSFWMRVTWSGIGFHDATWQPYFGGSLYLSNGSHGCINMPYNQAQALYSMLEIGTPVVIHY